MMNTKRLAAPIAALCLLPALALGVAAAQTNPVTSPAAAAKPLVPADSPPDVTMRAVAEAVLRDLDANRETYHSMVAR